MRGSSRQPRSRSRARIRPSSPNYSTTAGIRSCGSKARDRKSTRLNSSHSQISYAVFCLKKKKQPIRLLVYGRDLELDEPKRLQRTVYFLLPNKRILLGELERTHAARHDPFQPGDLHADA